MKDILSIWLYQTLIILVLKHITICHASDPSESYDLERSYHEERSSNNRRGYREPDNISRANQNYEAAYFDRARRLRQQNYIYEIGETKMKPENLRQPHPDSEYNLQNAYPTNRGYGNTRNGDSSETIDVISAGTSSIEGFDSNVSDIQESSHANNTKLAFSIAKPSADSCSCQGTGASDEASFLCFSSKEGGKSFSIKSKGITKFNLEDIIKAYKLYYDNINVHNFIFENIINGESNLQHEFNGDNKFNVHLSKFKMNGLNEGNFNFEAESKFDINEIKNGGNKIKVDTFDKFDMNKFKKNPNKINFDNSVQNIDIQKIFNDNNKFNTQFDKNINGNSNLEANAEIAFKKFKSMTDSNKNSKFYFDNDLNVNQYNFDSDVQADAQAEFEAHAKAFAQAKVIAKAEAILQAQARAQAEAKARSIIQSQMIAQAQAQAHAKAQVHGNAQAYNQGQINSQAQPFGYTDNNNVRPNNGFNLGVGVKNTIFGNGGFQGNLGFNGGFGGGIANTFGGTWMSGGGGPGGAVGGRVTLARPAAVENDGLGTSVVMSGAYTGGEFNYADGLYDDNSDDGYTSVVYPGPVAYPAPSDNPISGNKFYGDGNNQKDLGIKPYSGFGYHRYT